MRDVFEFAGMTGLLQRRPLAAVVMIVVATAAPFTRAEADTVQVYAAGSLRGVMTELAAEAKATLQIDIQATFGGSGALRERIEKGEAPDLFLSADLASPRKLQAQGRTLVPVVAFARNRLCVLARRAAGVTTDNLVERMLARGVRVKTSTPIVDPSGDYAWSMFDRIDVLHPGAAAILKAKAQALMGAKAPPSRATQNPTAALFVSGQIDMSVTYCSGAAVLEKAVPGLVSLPVPERLDPHPVYGLAVLSARAPALHVALLLLSAKGQEIIGNQGLVPITSPQGGGS
ncbi:MAG TPA: substrate-binding domain-containing protein [Steroidobacteraceae bacterium]|jgi:ABC-type molybdate transport system substrate-binding protein